MKRSHNLADPTSTYECEWCHTSYAVPSIARDCEDRHLDAKEAPHA